MLEKSFFVLIKIKYLTLVISNLFSQFFFLNISFKLCFNKKIYCFLHAMHLDKIPLLAFIKASLVP